MDEQSVRHDVIIRAKPSSSMAALTITTSLLLTLLAPANDSAVPHSQHQWPTPQPRSAALLVSLATYPAPPLPDDDGGLPPPIGDLVAGGQELSLPRTKRHHSFGQATAPLLQTTLASVVGTPHKQHEWPVSRRQLRQSLSYTEWYVIDETSPFAQTSWPNPRSKPRASDLSTWADTRELSLGEPPKPHAQTEWPNPRGRGQSPELRKLLAWRDLSLEDTIDNTPQSLAEWPTPPRQRRIVDLLTWTQNLSQSTLAPADTPFTPVIFPTPPALASVISLRIEVLGRPSYYTDTQPFAQAEWPLAVVGAKRLPETWLQNVLGNVLSLAQEPFVSTDRPNPPLWRYQTLSWLDNLLSTTLDPGPDPRVQYDWPLFLARPPAIDLRTWIDQRKTYFAETPPSSLQDWPTPRPVQRVYGFAPPLASDLIEEVPVVDAIRLKAHRESRRFTVPRERRRFDVPDDEE